jgi:hypothetical protein
MDNGLGTLTSNVCEFLSGGAFAAPTVGSGATLVMWSDTHAYTVSRVSASGKSFWMKRDNAERVDHNGMSDSQDYRYTPQPDAPEEHVRMTKRGWMCRGQLVRVGYRREYYDYTF